MLTLRIAAAYMSFISALLYVSLLRTTLMAFMILAARLFDVRRRAFDALSKLRRVCSCATPAWHSVDDIIYRLTVGRGYTAA